MAMKRKLVSLLAAMFLAAAAPVVLPASSIANPAPSYSYCEKSLLGGGTLAPDNDIKRRWNWYENNYGVNIVAATFTGNAFTQSHDVQMQWRYTRANGAIYYAWAICADYRNEFPGGTYQDDA